MARLPLRLMASEAQYSMNASLRAAVIAEWRGLPEQKTATRPVAIPGRADAEADATPRLTRAPARNRSDRRLVKNRRRLHRRALAPVALREGILYVRVLQPALHYELEQISKSEILRKLKQRAAVIAEWRGLPDRKMRPDRWQSPAELMPKLMQRLGLRERLRETEVIDAWSKIVGDFIAAHSAPVALREGILYVRVLQPALHYELEQISKSEILRKLKQRFGGKTIRDVRFRVG